MLDPCGQRSQKMCAECASPMIPSRRKIIVRVLGLAALLTLAGHQLWRHGHDYVFADKFYEVDAGKVYRGAWQQSWPMQRIIRDRKIKTIVALAHPPDAPLVQKEKAMAAENHLQFFHIPIVEQQQRTTPMVENVSDQLERAAAVIADPKNQPVYFHCHHGINRASMVQIAYRTMYCDWTLERATQEVADTFGLIKVDHGPDYRHMEKFYNERVLPRRLARDSSTATTR